MQRNGSDGFPEMNSIGYTKQIDAFGNKWKHLAVVLKLVKQLCHGN